MQKIEGGEITPLFFWKRFGGLIFSTIFVEEPTTNQMKNSTTLRNLMLDLCEVGESINSFGYASKLMKALKKNQITFNQFELLCGDLYLHCQKNKIETSNDICSLFWE